jgi:hypothetical protein
VVDLLSLIRNGPLLRVVKAVDAVHHNGLTGTIGAYDRMDFALSNFQAYPRQSGNFAEIHVNIIQFEYDITLVKCV